MNLIIDIGNSSCKAALFKNGAIKEFHKGSNEIIEILDKWCRTFKIEKAIISSVIEIPKDMFEKYKGNLKIEQAFIMDYTRKFF